MYWTFPLYKTANNKFWSGKNTRASWHQAFHPKLIIASPEQLHPIRTSQIIFGARRPGRGCSSVGRASAWHAADAGSIPRYGKFFFVFFLPVSFQCRLSYGVRATLHAIARINICAHVKDPVDHVGVRRVMETLKHPACTVDLGSETLSQLVFPGERYPNFPREKSQWDNAVGKRNKKNIGCPLWPTNRARDCRVPIRTLKPSK